MLSYCYTPVNIPRHTDWNIWIYFSVPFCECDKNSIINSYEIPYSYLIVLMKVFTKCSHSWGGIIVCKLHILDFGGLLPCLTFSLYYDCRSYEAFLFFFHYVEAYRSIDIPVFKTSCCSDFYSLFIIVFSKEVSPVTQSYKATTTSVLHKIFTYIIMT